MVRRVPAVALLFAAMTAVAPARAKAQWSTAYEQFYLPGNFNWTFREKYPAADRLFAAFDYGHAILYEKLYTHPDANPSILEVDQYNFITRKLLVSPPRLPLEEAAIEVAYAKIAPEAKMMFDWAHLLHRQIYDVLANEGMSQPDKDATIARLVKYYKTRPDLAFSSVPKSMDLMEGQPYSLAFRNGYPKFNGLIWAYHWLQVGLYEPLLTGTNLDERQAGVAAAVTRFRQMLEGAPDNMPHLMPMTAAIAPTFAKRYTEAAIIFDNLHSMHDVVSDILANKNVPHNRKRAEILLAGSRYRDRTSFVISPSEWMDMAQMMGIENMGGPAVGLLPGFPAPTVARGALSADVMKNMAGMSGMTHGSTSSQMPGMTMPKHDSSSAMQMPGMTMKHDSSSATQMPGMNMSNHDGAGGTMPDGMRMGMPHDSPMSSMMMLHERMMADPIIRQRMMADTAMRRMMDEMMRSHSASGHAATMNMTGAHNMTKASKSTSGAKKKTTAKKGAAKKAPAKKPMDHSKMKMPGMKM